jgi:hypothetical protein
MIGGRNGEIAVPYKPKGRIGLLCDPTKHYAYHYAAPSVTRAKYYLETALYLME